MRIPNNPLLIQIERHARRAENWRMAKELVGITILLLSAFMLVFFLIYIFDRDLQLPSGTIIEDNRGPELKRLYDQALR